MSSDHVTTETVAGSPAAQPTAAPGTTAVQTPASDGSIGWLAPSHPFQSPTTLTRRADGAHTANAVPCTSPRGEG